MARLVHISVQSHTVRQSTVRNFTSRLTFSTVVRTSGGTGRQQADREHSVTASSDGLGLVRPRFGHRLQLPDRSWLYPMSNSRELNVSRREGGHFFFFCWDKTVLRWCQFCYETDWEMNVNSDEAAIHHTVTQGTTGDLVTLTDAQHSPWPAAHTSAWIDAHEGPDHRPNWG
jgi:hypothetical protein